MNLHRLLAMVLAGGKGERLLPLTKFRAKPAVMFGGPYRIIDFVLNNLVNSGIFKIKVLTQFKANSLINHLNDGWPLSRNLGQFVDAVPAQMQTGEKWYQGTADAIHQNLGIIHYEAPDLVLIFGGDHVYKMDIMQMVDEHVENGADMTVSAVSIPKEDATSLGVIQIDADQWVIGFEEKPEDPKPLPDDQDKALASMGNYIFNRDVLEAVLEEDAKNPESTHDFGKDIIPQMIHKYRVLCYDFQNNDHPGMEPQERGYWRDVGTIDSYYEANMDLRSVSPTFNLYNPEWPLRTAFYPHPPAKFVFNVSEEKRVGAAFDSLICPGAILSGGTIQNSIISSQVFVHSYAEVMDSIIMPEVKIGRGAKIKKAIIDKYVNIPPGEKIGFDLEKDSQRFTVSPEGVVVIGKETVIE